MVQHWAIIIYKIKEMNFDGAAVLGAIWNEPAHGIENFIKLKKNLLVQNSTQ